MRVAELWRYPIKSMRGESLDEVEIERDGIPGDRGLHVRDAGGLVTARTAPGLLGLTAVLDGAELLVDGRPWDGDQTAAAVAAAAGAGAHLAPASAGARFDDTPLLVVSDGAITALGRDGRRLRPNLVIEGVEGLAERDWPGRRLHAGGALIAVEHLCRRCVMTTFDPDTLAQDPDVLRDIRSRFDGRFALNCMVVEPGLVRLGDGVEVV